MSGHASHRRAARVWLLVLLAVLVLSACGRPAVRPPPAPAAPALPTFPTGAACVSALISRGVEFQRVDDRRQGQCGMDTAVRVRAGQAGLNRPVDLSCSMAYALDTYKTNVIQPLALRYFGQPVVRLHHYGGYVCRGRSGNPMRISEHALGRAIDIGGFELADGTMINVERHWRNAGNMSRFLQEAARHGCNHFSVVLGPNHDRAHADHLHFDIGRWRLCGA